MRNPRQDKARLMSAIEASRVLELRREPVIPGLGEWQPKVVRAFLLPVDSRLIKGMTEEKGPAGARVRKGTIS